MGEPLGGFSVRASATDAGCGPAALGAPPSFEFEVELSRQATELFWDGRASGRLSAADEFRVSAQVRLDVAESADCQLIRDDEISGRLSRDALGYDGFEGDMRYALSTRGDDACQQAASTALGLPRLPCEIGYHLSGVRIRPPE